MTRLFLGIVFVLSFFKVCGQDFKVGKLKQDQFAIDSPLSLNEAAIFIKKERHSEFKLNDWEEGWYAQKTVHNVIKINSSKGTDYGTVLIDLYKRAGKEERVDKLEGYTYELINGKLEKTKLDKKSIFKTTLNDNFDRVSFALPNVKEGVIIEYSYQVYSPFWKIDDLILQEDIPVIAYKAVVEIPEVFQFNTYYQGKYRCALETEVKRKSFNFSYRQEGAYGTKTQNTRTANMAISQAVYAYTKENIPPLKEEPYTNNLENFRSSVIYELATAELTQGNKKNFTTSWEEVAKTLNNSDRFGKRLEKTNFLKEEGDRFRESVPNQKERAYAIYDYVKKNVAWNGKYRSRVEQPLKKAYDNKEGTSAEVNLILVALLREAGLDAHPVLSATKNYKVPIFPTLEGFNNVIASISLNGKLLLLDATELNAKPGQLSENIRNWEGRLVRPDGSTQKVSLFSPKHVQEQIMVNITLDPDAYATGVFKERFRGDNEIAFRNQFSNKSIGEQKNYFKNSYNLEAIDTFELQSSLDKSAEVSFNFSAENIVEEINDKWYLKPLLFLSDEENPFKSKTRETPIDFKFPLIQRKIINIKIPANYTIENITKPIKFAMEGDLGDYSLTVSQNKDVVQIMSILKLNRTLFSPSEYETIRSFYTEMLEKQATPIVLKQK